MTRHARSSAVRPIPDLADLLAALGDESRHALVRLLADAKLRPASELASLGHLPASTCSYHLAKLYNSGETEVLIDGTSPYPVLRRGLRPLRSAAVMSAATRSHSGKTTLAGIQDDPPRDVAVCDGASHRSPPRGSVPQR